MDTPVGYREALDGKDNSNHFPDGYDSCTAGRSRRNSMPGYDVSYRQGRQSEAHTIAAASIVPRVSTPQKKILKQFKSPFHPSFVRESCELDESWPRPSSARFRAALQPRRVSDPPKRSRSTYSLNLGAAH